MQHHVDEFSVTDIRHTLHEVWRVVRNRRWFFIIPFCSASTLALIASFWAPRKYSTSTVIQRERDPVFATMMGRSWTQPYDEIHQDLDRDVHDVEFIASVLEDLGLTPGATCGANSPPSPEAVARRRGMAAGISAGLSTQDIERSGSRDVVSIQLTLDDPANMQAVLDRLREKYIEHARTRTLNILTDVKSYFEEEAARYQARLAEHEERLVKMELEFPGINPDKGDRAEELQATIDVDRYELEKKIAHLKVERLRLEGVLIRFDDPENLSAFLREQAAQVIKPNPRHAELLTQIEAVEGEIENARTMLQQTDEHPNVMRLQQKLSGLREKLAAAPPVLSEIDPEGPHVLHPQTQKQQVQEKINDLDRRTAALQAQHASMLAALKTIDAQRAESSRRRQEYLLLKGEIDELRNEAAACRQIVGPIDHVLKLEDRARSIHFSTVQPAQPVLRPSSPDGKMVLLICLAVGAGVAALVVLLRELLDHSFRSVRHLSTVLGVPVIESIDEIVTRAVRRKRLIKNLVFLPATTFVLAAALLLAGSAAFLSIENPSGLARLKQAPGRAAQLLLGRATGSLTSRGW